RAIKDGRGLGLSGRLSPSNVNRKLATNITLLHYSLMHNMKFPKKKCLTYYNKKIGGTGLHGLLLFHPQIEES
ncbi:MAG: hypothetical protein JG781_1233, partial [Peptococcaceae bacterium]|nr:hypothetical protein [Peptococcaceae bacterium]